MPRRRRNDLAAPPSARFTTIGVVALALVVETSLVTWGHVDVLVRATPAVLLVVALTLMLFWLPGLRLHGDGLEVRNPLRTHRVGWAAIDDVSTRWTLTLITGSRRIGVWTAPTIEANIASDSFPEWITSDGATRGRGTFDAATGGGFDARQALARQGGPVGVVIRQWLAHRLDAGASGEVVTRWNVPIIAAIGVLTALTVAGAVWR